MNIENPGEDEHDDEDGAIEFRRKFPQLAQRLEQAAREVAAMSPHEKDRLFHETMKLVP